MNRFVPFALLGLLFASFGCQSQDAQADDQIDPETLLDRDVEIEEVVIGEGPGADEADLLLVEYVGTFPSSGLRFDGNENMQSLVDEDGEKVLDEDGNEILVKQQPPFPFLLGAGHVIKGWDEGFAGMKVGGERILMVPWQKAYGKDGNGANIPAKQDLVFTVKLLDMVKAGEEGIYDVDDVVVGTGRPVQNEDKITIHYRGTYANGMRFDDSRERQKPGEEVEGGTPYTFRVGFSKVITGIDLGVIGMRTGGKRMLRIPSGLAFGDQGFQTIQGRQILYIEIDLISIH